MTELPPRRDRAEEGFVMRLLVDTSHVSFTVGREATPKNDQNGIQRTDP